MTDAEFSSIYSSFFEQIQRYNSAQRRELCEKTKTALVQILTSMPNPLPEERNISTITPESMKALIDLEMYMAEKMDQRNLLNAKTFYGFDPDKTGKILPDQFRSVIDSLGICLSDCELNLLTQKFGGEKQNGKICYEDFLQYVHAKRQIYQKKVNQTQPYRKNVENTKNNSVFQGLQKVREDLNAKSCNLSSVFQRLENGNNLVSISHLIVELRQMGFPKNAVKDDDISLTARIFSRRTPGYLTYQEFIAFFEGQTPSVQIEEKLRKFNQSELRQVLMKINNQSLHKVFKEIDTNRDGRLSTDDLLRGLMTFGLSKNVASNKSFREYTEFFMNKRRGCFLFNEFRKFAMSRGGNPYSSDIIRVPQDYSTEKVITILQKSSQSNLIEAFSEYDIHNTNQIGFTAFQHGLNSAGYILSNSQMEALFSKYAKKEKLNYKEFLQSINNRYVKSKKILQAPGGTISTQTMKKRYGLKIFASPGGNSTIDLTGNSKGNGKSDVRHDRPGFRALAPPGGVDHLSMGATPIPSDAPVERRGKIDGPRDQIHQWNSLPEPATTRRRRHFGSPDTFDFKPSEPTKNKNLMNPPGGKSNLDSAFNPIDQEVMKSCRRAINGGNSVLDNTFMSTLEEATKIGRKAVQCFAANSSLDNKFTPISDASIIQKTNRKTGFGRDKSTVLDYNTDRLSPKSRRGKGIGRTETTVDLLFNPNVSSVDQVPVRNLKGSMQNPGGESTLSSTLTPTGAPKIRAQKKLYRDSEAIVKRFESINVHTNGKKDESILETISKAVHSQGRIRHVFRKFNITNNSTGLAKEELRKGLIKLGVTVDQIQIDHLYSEFDKNHDGFLTYSEFVRMLTSGQLN